VVKQVTLADDVIEYLDKIRKKHGMSYSSVIRSLIKTSSFENPRWREINMHFDYLKKLFVDMEKVLDAIKTFVLVYTDLPVKIKARIEDKVVEKINNLKDVISKISKEAK